MMTKEFLHTLVRDREERSSGRTFTVPAPRLTDFGAPRAQVRGGILYTDYAPPAEQEVPQHMEMPAWVRTTRAYVEGQIHPSTNGGVGVLLTATGGVPEVRERHFARTDVRIGNVATRDWHSRFATVIERHALTLITRHHCFPDYNITNIARADNPDRYQVVTYRCAWCNNGFSLGV